MYKRLYHLAKHTWLCYIVGPLINYCVSLFLQVVKMMIFVVIVFGVCWLPYHLYFLLASSVPDITLAENVQQIYLVIYWIAMSNSMYNPIIYCWMNERYILDSLLFAGYQFQFTLWLLVNHIFKCSTTYTFAIVHICYRHV